MLNFTFILCDNLAISTCRNIIQPVRQIVGQRSIIIELQSVLLINLGEIQCKCIWRIWLDSIASIRILLNAIACNLNPRQEVRKVCTCISACFYESLSRHRKHREAVDFHFDLLLSLYVAVQFLYVDVRGLHVLDVNGFFALGFYTFREREVVGLHFSGVFYAEPVL